MPDDTIRFLHRYGIFLRKARDAARQSLFFLGLLYRTRLPAATRAVEAYAPFALRQARALLVDVALPSREQIPESGPAGRTAAVEQAARLIDTWRQEVQGFMEAEATLEEAHRLRQALEAFLRDSQAEHFPERLLHHRLPALKRILKKHIAWFFALALVLFVTVKVEAVNGLLLNEGLWVYLCIGLLFVPQIVWKARIRQVRRQPDTVPFWHIGGTPFWGARAVEPGPLVERWPLDDSAFQELHGSSILKWTIVVVGWFGMLAGAYFLGTLALLLLLGLTFGLGIWFFRNRWPVRMTILHAVIQGQLMKLCQYGLWWLIALGLVALRGGTTLTGFLILSLCYAILMTAYLVDIWDFLDPHPVRLLLLTASVVCLIPVLFGFGRTAFIGLMVLGMIGYGYGYYRNRQRPLRMVLFCVCAVLAGLNLIGGRTHDRAVWPQAHTTPSLERLTEAAWPMGTDSLPVVVMAASGGGSRAAVYAGLTLQQLNEDPALAEVAAHLQAISSVSGGSLANAAYVARLLNRWHSSGALPDTAARRQAVADLDTALGGDFLLPTLRGMLTPFTTRGAAIEAAWQQGDVHLENYTLEDLAAAWREAARQEAPFPPFPMPLFNTASLDGHDVVISPLSKTLYTRVEEDAQAQDPAQNYYRQVPDPTWVFYRDHVYGLEDLVSDFNPPLAASVRASANFPFGFPLVRVKTEKPLFFSPRPRQREVRLTDGGALSNSGLWSLFHLLVNNAPALKERGVLMIIVDASKMPVYRNVSKYYTSLWGTIGDQSPIGQNLHRRMFDVLEGLYGSRLAVAQIDLQPRVSHNVMTTWALDRRSLDTLRVSFNRRWQEERSEILRKWQVLLSGDTTATFPLIDRRRPPLD